MRICCSISRTLARDATLGDTQRGYVQMIETATGQIDELLAEQRSEAVSLLTFHAAKGREWWGVVVAGVEEGLVPHSSAASAEQLDEEARLFYVALTRAAQHLHVTCAARRGTRPASPSRWLGRRPCSGWPPWWW